MPRSAPVDGFSLEYDREGAGPPVVLLHGWPGDRSDHREVVPLLVDAADVVVPDLRGFGASDKHREDPADAYSAAAQARSVLGLIAELGLERPVLAGYDVGSRVAQTVARTAPAAIRALVVAPPLPGPGERVLTAQAQREFWYQPFHQLALAEELIDGDPRCVRAYLKHFWTHWSGPGFVPDDAQLDRLAGVYGAPGAFTASISWYRTAPAPSIRCPAWGTSSRSKRPRRTRPQSGTRSAPHEEQHERDDRQREEDRMDDRATRDRDDEQDDPENEQHGRGPYPATGARTLGPPAALIAAPVALRRAAAHFGHGLRAGQPPQLRLALARLPALRRLGVEPLRLDRRSPPLGRVEHVDDHARLAEAELQPIAGLDVPARLDRLAVDVHAPALDGVRRQRPRLHQPRRPQPLVDPDRLRHRETMVASPGGAHAARRPGTGQAVATSGSSA